jgi:hypothetical protein
MTLVQTFLLLMFSFQWIYYRRALLFHKLKKQDFYFTASVSLWWLVPSFYAGNCWNLKWKKIAPEGNQSIILSFQLIVENEVSCFHILFCTLWLWTMNASLERNNRLHWSDFDIKCSKVAHRWLLYFSFRAVSSSFKLVMSVLLLVRYLLLPYLSQYFCQWSDYINKSIPSCQHVQQYSFKSLGLVFFVSV